METPTQRLASAVKDQSEATRHFNSPVEQIRRRNLKGSEAEFVEGRKAYHDKNVEHVTQENAAIAKMNDRSGKGSPLSTTMRPVNKSSKK